MKIRIMTMKDFNQMYLLWKKVDLSIKELETEKEQTGQMIKLNPVSNFVAMERRKIIGTVFGTFNGRRGWIYRLAVHPNFQKKGLGSLLLKKAETALKKMGVRRVLLGIDEYNYKVIKFYKKCGYREIDDAIFMGKNL